MGRESIRGPEIEAARELMNSMENKASSSSGHGQQQQQQISFAMILPSPSSSSSSSMHGSFMRSSKASSSGTYELVGELDQALFMYLDGQQDPSASSQEHRQTLNIFPSQPMHANPPTTKGGTSLASPSMESAPHDQLEKDSKAAAIVKKEGASTMSSDQQEGPKTPDAKTLRRLAQNREAARKSRLRKKAYIQQLESSRIRLSQLEQELQRGRAPGLLLSGGAVVPGDQCLAAGIVGEPSADAAMFDMEYGRWQEDHYRLMCELRAAAQEQLPENELRMFVDGCLGHYDQLVGLKSAVARSDVFHLISGVWLCPAERCFMWIAGFRPSDLLKMMLRHIEGLTEQQVVRVCGLQKAAQETEESLSQGMETLNRSLAETVVADGLSCPPSMPNYMGQMAVAMDKLTTLESFVRQAESLRQQILHRLNHMLTTRQMARCLLAIAEYFHRLRALSSLWNSRPRLPPTA